MSSHLDLGDLMSVYRTTVHVRGRDFSYRPSSRTTSRDSKNNPATNHSLDAAEGQDLSVLTLKKIKMDSVGQVTEY